MKRLIFRLSSLGDVILSQALLETPYQGETHWVVAKEYESLLVGHPKLARVWSYDRKARPGLRHWLAFISEIQKQGFDEVIDLHSTLRTHVARIYFSFRSLTRGRSLRWKTISKERLRRAAYILLKRILPTSLRPTHLSLRASLLGGGKTSERPNLKWLLSEAPERRVLGDSRKRVAVIPASAWRGKEWPTARYFEVIQSLRGSLPGVEIVLIGVPTDVAVTRLSESLSAAAIPVVSWIGNRSLRQVAQLIASCDLAVGADTGLLHLAEAIGVPVVTVFGPTRADFGFGPLHPRSLPVETNLWCSPCSKDGSFCFRVGDHKYQCLKETESSAVLGAVRKSLSPQATAPKGLEI